MQTKRTSRRAREGDITLSSFLISLDHPLPPRPTSPPSRPMAQTRLKDDDVDDQRHQHGEVSAPGGVGTTATATAGGG